MTTSVLCQGVTAVQAAPINQGPRSGTTIGTPVPPVGTGLPSGSQAVQPATAENVINPQTQTFQVIVTATSGNCSGTVQVMASNDGVNWSAYGSPIAVTSGASPNIGTANGSQPWEFYTAYVTAISGTGAMVECTMGT